MRLSGRLSAAIAVLEDFEGRRVPLKTALADWARGARYAGAKDRAWISGLCLDVLRKRNSLGAAMGDETPRAAALGALGLLWRMPLAEIGEAAAEVPHGPGALTELEHLVLSRGPVARQTPPESSASPSPMGRGDRGEGRAVAALSHRTHPDSLGWNGPAASAPSPPTPLPKGEGSPGVAPPHVLGDFPEWLTPHMTRAFGEHAAEEGAALSARADVDLRVNALKTTPEKALDAIRSIGGEALPILTTALRIPAPDASEKTPAVTVIPAFNKGWFEVQDLGSQIAAAAAGAIKGQQVLDYCAGGGGKTLALAALMENKGQLYAWDDDARRLQPLYERARRAGVRNLQIRNPAGGDGLDDLAGRMDVVFVDAPCTGSGAWRRHPDTKWRLTPQQLAARMAEQDAILAAAAPFAKPGGRLVYVTCSIFMEENEDRIDAFLAAHPDFASAPAFDQIAISGILTDEGRAALEECRVADDASRLTPARLRCDGFFIAVMQQKNVDRVR